MNLRAGRSQIKGGWIVAILLLFNGCRVTIKVPGYYVPEVRPSRSFHFGAGKSDITPPPGFPLGGHSIAGRMARGYWTRLHARAFYFEDASGHALAMVSCDLFAIPAALSARVAQMVADKDRKIPLSPQSIILAATHTHSGPAGYMSSPVYNFGGLLPGYSKKLLETLAERIVDAIQQAHDDALADPNARYGLALRSGYAPDLQRNRAIDAFFLDSPAERDGVWREARAAQTSCPNAAVQDCPRYQAVDPTLKVLEVWRGDKRTALMVFFAIHPTAMSHDNTLYQSDLTGYAMDELERRGHATVAGFFNGAEGDISPRWVRQNRDEVMLLGGSLAGDVENLLRKTPPTSEPPEISTYGGSFRTFPADPHVAALKSLTLPGTGVAGVGGAEDGRTILWAYGWHGGINPNTTTGDPKIPAFDLHHVPALKILQQIIGAPKNYPQSVPVSAAQIGGVLSVAAVPVEMTTIEGRKLRADLQPEMGAPLVLVGLANEYLGYTTTAEEYPRQNYEGASTIFGAKEGAVLEELLRDVVHRPGRPTHVGPLVFNAGSKWPYQFGPELFGERYKLPYDSLEPEMADAQGRTDDAAPRFEWPEGVSGDWEKDQRKVQILSQVGSEWKLITDDSGTNLLTVLAEARPAPSSPRRSWMAIWINPRPSTAAAWYIFRVRPPGMKQYLCSLPFQLPKTVDKVPIDAETAGPQASCYQGDVK